MIQIGAQIILIPHCVTEWGYEEDKNVFGL